jgi:hypothetical protein
MTVKVPAQSVPQSLLHRLGPRGSGSQVAQCVGICTEAQICARDRAQSLSITRNLSQCGIPFGLKIRCPERGVSVRARPPVLDVRPGDLRSKGSHVFGEALDASPMICRWRRNHVSATALVFEGVTVEPSPSCPDLVLCGRVLSRVRVFTVDHPGAPAPLLSGDCGGLAPVPARSERPIAALRDPGRRLRHPRSRRGIWRWCRPLPP